MDWQKHFADRGREPSTFGGMQGDDIAAINKYIVYTKTNSKGAIKIRDEWIKWHDNLGWWDKNMDSSVYDEARNKRNAFNNANAKDAAELAQVKLTQQTGLSTEEMYGGTRRVLADGTYETPDPVIVPTSMKLAVGVTGAAALAGYIAFKLYFPSFLLPSRK